jgi:hypothetical protein
MYAIAEGLLRNLILLSVMLPDFEIFTTTTERLLTGDKKVWLKPYEVDWDDPLEFHSLPLKF